MTIRLNVVDRDGSKHEIDVPPTGSLMEALRELEYGVMALCGGMCACATCHIYVAANWLSKLPPRQGDERELLRDLQFRRDDSRLSCQIELDEALDGLSFTLAPEE